MNDIVSELELLRAVVHKQRNTHRRQGHLLGLQRVLKCGLAFVDQPNAYAFEEMKKWAVDCSGKLCGLIAHGHFLNYSLTALALIARLITRAEHLVTKAPIRACTAAGTIDKAPLGSVSSSQAGDMDDMGDIVARSVAESDDDGDMGTCVARLDNEEDVGMSVARADDDGDMGTCVARVDEEDVGMGAPHADDDVDMQVFVARADVDGDMVTCVARADAEKDVGISEARADDDGGMGTCVARADVAGNMRTSMTPADDEEDVGISVVCADAEEDLERSVARADDDRDMGTCAARADDEEDVGMGTAHADGHEKLEALVEEVEGRDEVIAAANVPEDDIIVDPTEATCTGVPKSDEIVCVEEAACLLHKDVPQALVKPARVLGEIVPELLVASSPQPVEKGTGGSPLPDNPEGKIRCVGHGLQSVDRARISFMQLEKVRAESGKRIESTTTDSFAEEVLSTINSLPHPTRSAMTHNDSASVKSVPTFLDVTISSIHAATTDDAHDRSPQHTIDDHCPPASKNEIEAPRSFCDGDTDAVLLYSDRNALPAVDDEELAPSLFCSDDDMSLSSDEERGASRSLTNKNYAPASSSCSPGRSVERASGNDAVSCCIRRRSLSRSRLRRFRRIAARMRRVRKNTHKRKNEC